MKNNNSEFDLSNVQTQVCSLEKAKQFVKSECTLLSSVPEYNQFCTGVVEFKNYVLAVTDTLVPMLHERKEGTMGDVIEMYTKLLFEEQMKNTFWGKVKRYLNTYRYHKRDTDRWYVLRRLKEPLQGVFTTW